MADKADWDLVVTAMAHGFQKAVWDVSKVPPENAVSVIELGKKMKEFSESGDIKSLAWANQRIRTLVQLGKARDKVSAEDTLQRAFALLGSIGRAILLGVK